MSPVSHAVAPPEDNWRLRRRVIFMLPSRATGERFSLSKVTQGPVLPRPSQNLYPIFAGCLTFCQILAENNRTPPSRTCFKHLTLEQQVDMK